MFAEFVGLTQEAITAIERLRKSPEESRSDIIVRALGGSRASPKQGFLDLGEGVKIAWGERPMLFLTKEAKREGRPDAIAEVKPDGFYLNGERIRPSKRGNPLDPAMKIVQAQNNHRNDKGEIISLSAWRQWHVHRDGKLISLVELKDPALARTRNRPVLSLADLGWSEEVQVTKR
jgi:hypothetical protein